MLHAALCQHHLPKNMIPNVFSTVVGYLIFLIVFIYVCLFNIDTGIETLTDYRFKFGRSALLEGGLAVNPSGCARSEPRARSTWRRALVAAPAPAADLPHPACPYSKQFVHTKSSQYKKMKMEWRNNVYLAR